MFTQCPQCRTIYPLSTKTLCESRGHVRCGRCGEVFQSLDALSDEAPEDDLIPAPFFSERPPTLKPPKDEKSAREQDLFLDKDPPPIDFEHISLDTPGPGHSRPEPVYPNAKRKISNKVRPSAFWRFSSFILLLALIGQAGWGYRETLIHHPNLRPWLDKACEQFGCTLPRQTALDQIRLISRNIRPHPSVEGALIITATMQNQARFIQNYPKIDIVLSNLEGRVVAQRRFLPDDYLNPGLAKNSGLAPDTLLPLVFEVVDPGNDAVAFEFTFR